MKDRARDTAGEKERIRREILKRRRGLSQEYCRQADEAIVRSLLESSVYKTAGTVFVYVSMEGEVDTGELIRFSLEAGKVVAVPRCVDRGIMKACRIGGFGDLEKGAYGIWEPKESCGETDPGEVDLAVAPCVSCSHDGKRLGYGGGYYDRYLPSSPAFRVALCREKLVCSRIPVERTDSLMDLVITEAGRWRAGVPENGIFTKIERPFLSTAEKQMQK